SFTALVRQLVVDGVLGQVVILDIDAQALALHRHVLSTEMDEIPRQDVTFLRPVAAEPFQQGIALSAQVNDEIILAIGGHQRYLRLGGDGGLNFEKEEKRQPASHGSG